MASNLVESLSLVVRPGATSSFLLLVAMPLLLVASLLVGGVIVCLIVCCLLSRLSWCILTCYVCRESAGLHVSLWVRCRVCPYFGRWRCVSHWCHWRSN